MVSKSPKFPHPKHCCHSVGITQQCLNLLPWFHYKSTSFFIDTVVPIVASCSQNWYFRHIQSLGNCTMPNCACSERGTYLLIDHAYDSYCMCYAWNLAWSIVLLRWPSWLEWATKHSRKQRWSLKGIIYSLHCYIDTQALLHCGLQLYLWYWQ